MSSVCLDCQIINKGLTTHLAWKRKDMLYLKLKRFTSVFQVMSLSQVHLLVAPKVLGAVFGINSFFVIII